MWRPAAWGLVALFLLPPFLATPPVAATARWTFMVYLDADNDLEDVGIEDFLEMAEVGSTAAVNVVVQFDRAMGYDSRYGDWTGTRRYLVQANMQPTAPAALQDLGEVNMADPANLTDFVVWAVTTYPADRYFLDLWDHGDGWEGVVVDNDPVVADRLQALELESALRAAYNATGRKIDLLGNDACRMTLEIQYQLRGLVDYFVGSEKDEPEPGWPYDAFLTAINAAPAMEPVEVGRALVDAYVDSYENQSSLSVTLSVVSAAGLPAVRSALDDFLATAIDFLPFYRTELEAASNDTERYETGRQEADLGDFALQAAARVPHPRLGEKADALRAALPAAVLAERHWDAPSPANGVRAARATGLSIRFPWTAVPPAYLGLALARDSLWDEFLGALYTGTRPVVSFSLAATMRDTEGDEMNDTVETTYQAALAGGSIWFDVYWRDRRMLSQALAASSGSANLTPSLPGTFDLHASVFDGAGKLVNYTVVLGLKVERSLTLRVAVAYPDGTAVRDAQVRFRNERTNATVEASFENGFYATPVVFPRWAAEGDPVEVRVLRGGWSRSASSTLNVTPFAFNGAHDFAPVTVPPTDLTLPLMVILLVSIVANAGLLLLYLRSRRPKVPPPTPPDSLQLPPTG